MKPYQVVCYGMHITQEAKAKLSQYAQVRYFDRITHHNHAEFVDAIAQADGVVGYGVRITQEMIGQAPKLKAVSTISVGYDAFDLEALNHRKIPLMHTPDILTDTVADAAFALLFACARRTVELDQYVRQGQWQQEVAAEYYGCDIHHKTLGIVGMGRIGAAIAKRASAGFAMSVLYHARTRHLAVEQQYQAQACSLEQLLAEVDFLCITLPATPQTYHFIGADQLAKMKPSSILINVGRGSVIDESALIKALQQGSLRAAGLDVFAKEPLPLDSPLLQLNNTVLSPHIGSATEQTRAAMQLLAVDNLYHALHRSITKNCVNLAALQG